MSSGFVKNHLKSDGKILAIVMAIRSGINDQCVATVKEPGVEMRPS
jgi:hypothetical protein